MNDLIRRYDAMRAIHNKLDNSVSDSYNAGLRMAEDVVHNMPSAQLALTVDVENVLALLDGIHSSGRMEYYSDYCALHDAIADLLPG